MPHKVSWVTTDDLLYSNAKKAAAGATAGSTNASKVFIGGLNWDTDEGFLREMLEDCGRIVDIHVPVDPVSKHCKGIAFVTFSSASEAESAIREWNNKQVDDMKLRVSIAKSESDNKEKFGVVYNRTKDDAIADANKRRERAQKKREDKRMQPY